MRVHLRSGIRWLEGARLPLETLVDFVMEAPRLRARARVLAELREAAAGHPQTAVPVDYLVNCCVNNSALAGDSGPTLAAWLVEHGIDASLYSPGAGEDWVIVFNPAIIASIQPVPASRVDLAERTLPRVAEQSDGVDDLDDTSCEEVARP